MGGNQVMGGYTYSGTVTFEFTDLFVEGTDPYETRHYVESMSAEELLSYSDDPGFVTIERERIT